jgi:selenocysteine lyase/cysteine desulfurase
LDSATLNLLPKNVIEAQSSFYNLFGSTPRKIFYARSRKTTELYLNTKESLSKKFGKKSENYAFTPNVDYSWNQILRSLCDYNDDNGTKLNVISSHFEHNSLLSPLQQLHKRGLLKLRLISEFELNDSFESVITENSLIALNHISPILGKYRDLTKLSELTKSRGSLLAVDYSRSAGQSPIDLDICDIAIIDPSTDHLSPQGLAISYLTNELIQKLENPFPGSGSIKYVTSETIEQLNSIEKFEVGNVNMSGVNGMFSSLEYMSQIVSQTYSDRQKIQSYLRKRLSELEYVSIISYDDFLGKENGNVLSCILDGFSAHDTVLMLEEIGNVEVRSGRLCSHTGLDFLKLDDVIQISTHVYNDTNDIDRLISALEEISKVF